MKKKTKMEFALEKLALIGRAFDNPTRIRIIELCMDKEYNISQLKKRLDVSYVGVYGHIRTLEKAGLIKTKKQKNVSGQAVAVSTDLFLFLTALSGSISDVNRELLNKYKKGLKDRIDAQIDSSNKKPVNVKELMQILSGIPFDAFISAYREDFEVYLDRNGKKIEDKK